MKGVDLSGIIMPDAILSGADLEGANLQGADMTGANLSGANLSSARLLQTDLLASDMSNAILSNVNTSVSESEFISQDINFHADMSFAILKGVDISQADLSYVIIVDQRGGFENVKADKKTNLSNAIITDYKFILYLQKYTENVPKVIKNKKELGDRLNAIDYSVMRIGLLKKRSSLPD